MPDGVVQWFDGAAGEAAVVKAGRVFIVDASEMEPAARHPGARVHFDINRVQGVEHAVRVTVQPGTRTARHHRRVGDLNGAHRADAKGSGHELHPLELAREWARALIAGDLDEAMSHYPLDIELHIDGTTLVGRSHVQGYLERSPLLGVGVEPDVLGEDQLVVVRWEAFGDRPGIDVFCRIAHGQIVAQWIGPTVAAGRSVKVASPAGHVELTIVSKGDVSEDAEAYATKRLGAVIGQLEHSVLFARVNLIRASDPARERPAIAKVMVDVDGTLLRAHVAAHDMHEAIDLLQARLRDKLQHRAQQRDALRTRIPTAGSGEWRHGALLVSRPEYFDRPVEERRLVRHKSIASDEMTPDEAAFDMEQLDFDFHLFRDLATGDDALIERLAGGRYRLTRLHPTTIDPGPTAVPLEIASQTPSALSVTGAVQQLEASGDPLVFFADTATERGSVVYHRYDGNYGVLTLA